MPLLFGRLRIRGLISVLTFFIKYDRIEEKHKNVERTVPVSKSSKKKAMARALEEERRARRNKIILFAALGVLLVGVILTVALLAGGGDEPPKAPSTIETVEGRLKELVRAGEIVNCTRVDRLELDDIAKNMNYDGEIAAGVAASRKDARLYVLDFGSEETAKAQLEPLRESLASGSSIKRHGQLLFYGDAELIELCLEGI